MKEHSWFVRFSGGDPNPWKPVITLAIVVFVGVLVLAGTVIMYSLYKGMPIDPKFWIFIGSALTIAGGVARLAIRRYRAE
jgi:hypothetical protein